MKWIIRKISNSRYSIFRQGREQEVGFVEELDARYRTGDAPPPWRVVFHRVGLTSTHPVLAEAIAYVRGVEAATRLYGKEVHGD